MELVIVLSNDPGPHSATKFVEHEGERFLADFQAFLAPSKAEVIKRVGNDYAITHNGIESRVCIHFPHIVTVRYQAEALGDADK